MVLIIGGMVDMHSREGAKFMHLPPNSIFNDYQIIFNLKSNITFKSFTPLYVNEAQMRSKENNTQTMNLDADTFRDLLELYPHTKTNLKLRALEKRSIFMYYKNKMRKTADIKLRMRGQSETDNEQLTKE